MFTCQYCYVAANVCVSQRSRYVGDELIIFHCTRVTLAVIIIQQLTLQLQEHFTFLSGTAKVTTDSNAAPHIDSILRVCPLSARATWAKAANLITLSTLAGRVGTHLT